jgi:hypothetical protein
MVASVASLNSANYYLSASFGYILIITGVFGNITDILVFTQLRLFRKNPSAFFLIVISTVECIVLLFASSNRVVTITIGYDPTSTSLAWCKIRAYILQYGGTVLSTTICFAAIDQYLSTSFNIQVRQISTFKLAQHLVGILIVLATPYSIPALVYQDIRSYLGCTTYDSSYNYFYSVVHLCIVIGVLPIVVSSLFSILAFQNVRRIVRRQIPVVRRRLDRQLTAMILVRVALFVITTLPYVIFRTYEINDPVDVTDNYAFALDVLIRTVVSLFYNVNYSVFDFLFFIHLYFIFFRVVSIFSWLHQVVIVNK